MTLVCHPCITSSNQIVNLVFYRWSKIQDDYFVVYLHSIQLNFLNFDKTNITNQQSVSHYIKPRRATILDRDITILLLNLFGQCR